MHQSEQESRFKECVEHCLNSHVIFWEILQEKNPLFEIFVEAGFNILKSSSLLEKMWNGFRRKKCISVNSLRIYATLCDEIFEDPFRANEIRGYLHEAKDSIHEDSLLTYAKNGAGVVKVFSEGEHLSKIFKYNAAFSSLTGYTMQELVLKPLDSIMPPIYKNIHKPAMIRLYRYTEESTSMVGKEKHFFMMNKAKYLLPVVIKFAEVPNYANGYTYVASVTLDRDLSTFQKLHLLLSTNREIIAVSQSTSFIKYFALIFWIFRT